MSLVGPRPHPIEMNSFYENKIENYMSRHRIKPGMTGLAQVNSYRGGDTPELIKRVYYDLKYIRVEHYKRRYNFIENSGFFCFQKSITAKWWRSYLDTLFNASYCIRQIRHLLKLSELVGVLDIRYTPVRFQMTDAISDFLVITEEL